MSQGPTVGTLAQVACLIEVTAAKPGNVDPTHDFDDTTYLDFLVSAGALGQAIDRSLGAGVGAIVLDVVESTRRLVSTNTNLGMALLLAPLALVDDPSRFESGTEAVLRATTFDDARLVYQAIRAARPGGLGRVAEEDVHDAPTRPLREVMRLAAGRDLVARQFADGFAEVFEAARTIGDRLSAGSPLETAVIGAHLGLMAAHPDSLIARKRGADEARTAREMAAWVLEGGWPARPEGTERLVALDRWLRAEGHARNPGTTADLVAAALFVALRDGTIGLPLTGGRLGWSSAAT